MTTRPISCLFMPKFDPARIGDVQAADRSYRQPPLVGNQRSSDTIICEPAEKPYPPCQKTPTALAAPVKHGPGSGSTATPAQQGGLRMVGTGEEAGRCGLAGRDRPQSDELTRVAVEAALRQHAEVATAKAKAKAEAVGVQHTMTQCRTGYDDTMSNDARKAAAAHGVDVDKLPHSGPYTSVDDALRAAGNANDRCTALPTVNHSMNGSDGETARRAEEETARRAEEARRQEAHRQEARKQRTEQAKAEARARRAAEATAKAEERKRKPFELPKHWSDTSRREFEKEKDKPTASVLQAISELADYKMGSQPPHEPKEPLPRRSASAPLPSTAPLPPFEAVAGASGTFGYSGGQSAAKRKAPEPRRSSSGPPFAKRPRSDGMEPRQTLEEKISSFVSAMCDLEGGGRDDGTTAATTFEDLDNIPVAEVISLILESPEGPRHPRAYHSWFRLGIEPGVTRPALRKRFLALSLRLHPDKCSHPQAREAFQHLHAVFRKLTEDAEPGR